MDWIAYIHWITQYDMPMLINSTTLYPLDASISTPCNIAMGIIRYISTSRVPLAIQLKPPEPHLFDREVVRSDICVADGCGVGKARTCERVWRLRCQFCAGMQSSCSEVDPRAEWHHRYSPLKTLDQVRRSFSSSPTGLSWNFKYFHCSAHNHTFPISFACLLQT
jgi:hypothetical protein